MILAVKGLDEALHDARLPPGGGAASIRCGDVAARPRDGCRPSMRDIGRNGCEHFAEIITECGRCPT